MWNIEWRTLYEQIRHISWICPLIIFDSKMVPWTEYSIFFSETNRFTTKAIMSTKWIESFAYRFTWKASWSNLTVFSLISRKTKWKGIKCERNSSFKLLFCRWKKRGNNEWHTLIPSSPGAPGGPCGPRSPWGENMIKSHLGKEVKLCTDAHVWALCWHVWTWLR